MIAIPLALLLLAVVSLLALQYVRRRRAAEKSRRLAQAIADHRAGQGIPIGRRARLWAEVLTCAGLLEPLIGHHNQLVLGTKAAGRQAIMLRAVDMVNARFESTRQAALYLDVRQLAALSTARQWTSLETLFRQLIQVPLNWHQALLQAAQAPLDRALIDLTSRLREQLASADLDTLALRDLFYAWLDAAQIKTIALFLDDFSALPTDLGPVLLQMLEDTFPRGGRMRLIVAGTKEKLSVEKVTAQGSVGLQMKHDVLIGLDLDGIVKSEDLRPSLSEPRQAFIFNCIRAPFPQLAERVQHNSGLGWESMFHPREAWFDLFRASRFDVEIAAAALEDLLPDLLHQPDLKINAGGIATAVERARVQAEQSAKWPKE